MTVKIPASELLEIANAIEYKDNSMCDLVLEWFKQHNPSVEYYSQVCHSVCLNICKYIMGNEDIEHPWQDYIDLNEMLFHFGLSNQIVIEMYGFSTIHGQFSRVELLECMTADKFVFEISDYAFSHMGD